MTRDWLMIYDGVGLIIHRGRTYSVFFPFEFFLCPFVGIIFCMIGHLVIFFFFGSWRCTVLVLFVFFVCTLLSVYAVFLAL